MRSRCLIYFFLCVGLAVSGCTARQSDSVTKEARPVVSYSVLLVYGNGVNVHQGYAVFQQARHRLLAETGIKLNAWDSMYMYRRRSGNPEPGKFLKSWKTFIDQRVASKYDVVLLLLPESETLKYKSQNVSGFSQGIGIVGRHKNNLAYTIVTGNRALDSYVLLHEVGHLLGAEHSDGGIMSAKLGSLRHGFTADTVREFHGQKPQRNRMPFRSAEPMTHAVR